MTTPREKKRRTTVQKAAHIASGINITDHRSNEQLASLLTIEELLIRDLGLLTLGRFKDPKLGYADFRYKTAQVFKSVVQHHKRLHPDVPALVSVFMHNKYKKSFDRLARDLNLDAKRRDLLEYALTLFLDNTNDGKWPLKTAKKFSYKFKNIQD